MREFRGSLDERAGEHEYVKSDAFELFACGCKAGGQVEIVSC